MIKNIPRVEIVGNASGSGKTTIICGILKALKNRGINVSACKCGPDYIDTMFHTKVLGIPSNNLDNFFCNNELMRELFYKHNKDSQITIIEGVMGYYDGISMSSTKSSSYDIGKSLNNTPVILIINSKGMAITAVSIIKGIVDFKKDSNIKGVILNNISKSVFKSLKEIIKKELNIETLGYFPWIENINIKNRHLGLTLPEDIKDISEKIETLGKTAEECIDIDKIFHIANMSSPINFSDKKNSLQSPDKKIKIGIAFDKAFCFYYKDNLELLESLGCELIYFSPINDKKLPKEISGVILGGGYPELHLKELSENKEMLKDISQKLNEGMPCLAECGGFMYLHKTACDKNGKTFNMVGFINGKTFFQKSLSKRFGYITLNANHDSYILRKGEKIKAHEFHYWDSSDNGGLFLAEKPTGSKKWNCIHSVKNTICGYPHIFYHSNPKFIKNFTKKCIEGEKNVKKL